MWAVSTNKSSIQKTRGGKPKRCIISGHCQYLFAVSHDNSWDRIGFHLNHVIFAFNGRRWNSPSCQFPITSSTWVVVIKPLRTVYYQIITISIFNCDTNKMIAILHVNTNNARLSETYCNMVRSAVQLGVLLNKTMRLIDTRACN